MARLLQYQSFTEPLFARGGEVVTADTWQPPMEQPRRVLTYSLAALVVCAVLGDIPRASASVSAACWHPAIEQPQARRSQQYLYAGAAADPLPRVAGVDGWHPAIELPQRPVARTAHLCQAAVLNALPRVSAPDAWHPATVQPQRAQIGRAHV